MSHPSKRRATRSPSPQLPLHYLDTSIRSSDVPHIFRVQAHEAILVNHDRLARETETTQEQGGRMGRWSGSGEGKDEQVWVDRYDILNLVPSLPPGLPFSDPTTTFPVPSSSSSANTAPPQDERGFSDLASDHEEEFYFRQLPPEEREELEKKRKRRRLERGREERMRLLEEQEAREREAAGEASVGDEETEPSETQLSMMKKLHTTLSAAQNPSLLEMRILTNHSNDPKFQFLKKGGKWRDVWERIRRGEKVEFEKKNEDGRTGGGVGLAGLGDYGSSDSENEEEEKEEEKEEDVKESSPQAERTGVDSGDIGVILAPLEDSVDSVPVEEDEEERKKKEAKAEKVKEWARKRKEARECAEEGL
ncbi:hypothetical protein JCM3765_005510 [Sporobolomyces pararoseus]